MRTMRPERLGKLLVEEISDILRTRVKDPRVGFVTITGVVMTPDLRIAKVYFSVLGNEEERSKSIQALESARTFIQSEVGSRIRLRFNPELHFHQDTSLEYGARIESLLARIHAQDRSKDISKDINGE